MAPGLRDRARRPVLVVGDVQGDDERLREALRPYPEDEVETVFLGDFFQGGREGTAGGAAAARIARGRRNARHVLGNHDLFLLAVLEHRRDGPDAPVPWGDGDGRSLERAWLSRRGDWADLRAVDEDPGLEAWLRSLPFLLQLGDGTLVQHSDADSYAELGSTVDEVNQRARGWLGRRHGAFEGLRHLVHRHAFRERGRLEPYLRHFGASRVVHGHTPHWDEGPSVRHGGLALSFDGRFSRYWQRDPGEDFGPIGATVALLPPLPSPAGVDDGPQG